VDLLMSSQINLPNESFATFLTYIGHLPTVIHVLKSCLKK
jgi:hypothetical protein